MIVFENYTLLNYVQTARRWKSTPDHIRNGKNKCQMQKAYYKLYRLSNKKGKGSTRFEFALITALQCCIFFVRIELHPLQILPYLLCVTYHWTNVLAVKRCCSLRTSSLIMSLRCPVDEVVQWQEHARDIVTSGMDKVRFSRRIGNTKKL